MKNEYYVAIDSNGEPYIEHAIFGRNSGGSNSRGSRQNVKYLEKIKDGARTRYFYTQDELQAYYDNMRGKAKDTAQQAKQKAQKVAERAKVEARYAVGSAQKEARDRAYDEMVRASRDAGRVQVQGATNTSAARQAQNDAIKAKAKLKESYDNRLVQEGAEAAKRRYDALKQKYADTPLAKVEKAKEKVEQTTDNLVVNASKAKADAETFGKEVANGIKNMASDMSGAGTKESLNKVKAEREEAIKKAEKAEQKAEKLMARADRDGWYNTLNEAVNASDAELEAIRALNNAKTADERVKFWTKLYGDTPLGKIENSKEKVESAAKSLKEQVKSLIPGAKVSGNKLVMPSGNEVIIPEQFIKEKTIPETFIEEQLIKEKKRTKK